MGYTITVPLTKDAPAEKLSKIFEQYFEGSYASTNYKEHGYPVEQENAVYLSYSSLCFEEHYLLNYLINLIYSKYGLKKNILNENYFYYFYDDQLKYLIDKDEVKKFIEYNANIEEEKYLNFEIKLNDYSDIFWSQKDKEFLKTIDLNFFENFELKFIEIKKLMETL